MSQSITKVQFALFTLLQSFSQDDELLDFIDDTKELEEYILKRFQEIYLNTNIETEDNILNIQLTPPSEMEAGHLKKDKDKIYVYFQVGFDAKTFSSVEEALNENLVSPAGLEKSGKLLFNQVQGLRNLSAVPICQPGDPRCRNRARVLQLWNSIDKLKKIRRPR